MYMYRPDQGRRELPLIKARRDALESTTAPPVKEHGCLETRGPISLRNAGHVALQSTLTSRDHLKSQMD